jgi:UrcA family protein
MRLGTSSPAIGIPSPTDQVRTMARERRVGRHDEAIDRIALGPLPVLSNPESAMTKLLSTAAALTMLIAFSAHGETQRPTKVSTTVAYQPQDLASLNGAAKMLSRIELAAQRLCAPSSPVANQTSPRVLACRHDAVERAVGKLDAPLVTAAYKVRVIEVARR